MANGLLVGSYYIILALGLSLIFSLGGVVNLAHGAFYALGAYFAVEIQRRLGFLGAVIIAPVLVGIIGMVIETLFIRRLYREDPALTLLFTFGLAMATEQSLRLVWGATGLPFPMPEMFRGVLLIGDFIYSYYRLTMLGVAARGDRHLAAAAQDAVRHDRARAHERPRDGARARHQPAPRAHRDLRPRHRARRPAGVMSAPLAGVQPAMGIEILTAPSSWS